MKRHLFLPPPPPPPSIHPSSIHYPDVKEAMGEIFSPSGSSAVNALHHHHHHLFLPLQL